MVYKMKVKQQYTPREYQNEFMKLLKENPGAAAIRRRQSSSRIAIGIDLGSPDGDKTVITQAKINSKGQITKIFYDEYETWPNYKWYKNPIKLIKWQMLMRKIRKNAKLPTKNEQPDDETEPPAKAISKKSSQK